MKRFTFLFIFISVIVSQNSLLYSQNNIEEKSKYAAFGIFGGVNLIENRTSIPLLPGSSDCGNFENGESMGYFGGLSGSYPIISNFLYFEGRLIYDYRPGVFSATSSNFEIYNDNTQEYEFLEINHSYESSLTYLVVDLGLKIIPVENIPLYLRVGFDAGNPIFSSNYSNTQTIASPANALFPSGTKERTIEEGELNSAGTSLGASVGLGYEIELNPEFYISPELSYRYGINSVSSDFDWKTNLIRVGLHASWSIELSDGKRQEKPDVQAEEYTSGDDIDTEEIIVKQDAPIEEVIIVEKEELPKDLIESLSVNDLNLTETIVTQTYPLLPYIFFDNKSNQLKGKYIQEIPKDAFTEDMLSTNTLDIYYNMLDIIGSRMLAAPNAGITLIGTSDGREADAESERIKIAEGRAKSVAAYLQNKWKILSSRINIATSDKPALATSEAYEQGFEENRRVEITTNHPELLAPVIHSQFLEFSSEQKYLSIDSKINDKDITNWQFAIVDEMGNEIHKSSGNGSPEEFYQLGVNQILLNDAAKALHSNNNLNVKLKVTNSTGLTESKKVKLQVNLMKNKYEVGRLNLIVFDFDRYDISSLNLNLIKNFVKSAIQENSTVAIIGSTDLLGEKKYNYQLSRDRAKAVEKHLKSISPNANIIEVSGNGPDEIKYDNSSPEGRFYCRTVMIQVMTPTGK